VLDLLLMSYDVSCCTCGCIESDCTIPLPVESVTAKLPENPQKCLPSPLQLGLALHLLKNRLHLGRLHNIPLNLEFPTHKQLLRIRLPLYQFPKICITQRHRDCRFLAIGCGAFACFAAVFEIDVPGFLGTRGVFEGEGEDGAAFFDCVFALGFGGEGGVYGVEGGGGGEVCCVLVSRRSWKAGSGKGQLTVCDGHCAAVVGVLREAVDVRVLVWML
jgi:hypothetical protein